MNVNVNVIDVNNEFERGRNGFIFSLFFFFLTVRLETESGVWFLSLPCGYGDFFKKIFFTSYICTV